LLTDSQWIASAKKSYIDKNAVMHQEEMLQSCSVKYGHSDIASQVKRRMIACID